MKLTSFRKWSTAVRLGIVAVVAALSLVADTLVQIQGPAWIFGPVTVQPQAAPELCVTNLGSRSLTVYIAFMKSADSSLVRSDIVSLNAGQGTCIDKIPSPQTVVAGVTIYQQTDSATVTQALQSLAVSLRLTLNTGATQETVFVPPLLLPSVRVPGNEFDYRTG